MRKTLAAALTAAVLTVGTTHVANAESRAGAASASSLSSSNDALLQELASLLETVKKLQSQVAELQERNAALSGAVKTLEFSVDLTNGAEGGDVELLQKILATDPAVYPEGRVTGHFGPMTGAALVRFKARYGLPATAELDLPTRELLNRIIAEAGVTGIDIPTGLIVSHGGKFKVEVRTEHGKLRYEIEKKEGEDRNKAEDDNSDNDGTDGRSGSVTDED